MDSILHILLFISTLPLAQAINLSTILPLKAALYGTTFDAQITLGNQTFEVAVDTGSSDTWVLGSSWQCISPNGSTLLPRVSCHFGSATYHPSSTFKLIRGEWLGDHYGQGDALGFLGYEDIRLGAIEIKQQEIGVVNMSSDTGDEVNVGLVAFGYPSISAIHPDSYPKNESLLGDRLLYPTIFKRLIEEGMEPYISLALERTPLNEEIGFGGYLGLGTLPPVAHGPFVTVPVEITKTIPTAILNGTRQISEWTLTVQSVSYGSGAHYSTPFQAFVDSGNWVNVVPPKLAREVNRLFSPPAIPSKSIEGENESLYKVDCNATAPSFAVEIGGKSFSIDQRDMVWRDPSGSCFSSVAPGAAVDGIDLLVLGDAFLKNVVAVFDMGKDQMRFAERKQNGTIASPSHSGAASMMGSLQVMSACVLAVCLAFVVA